MYRSSWTDGSERIKSEIEVTEEDELTKYHTIVLGYVAPLDDPIGIAKKAIQLTAFNRSPVDRSYNNKFGYVLVKFERVLCCSLCSVISFHSSISILVSG